MTSKTDSINIYQLVKEVEVWNNLLGFKKTSGLLDIDLYPLQKNYDITESKGYTALKKVIKSLEIIGFESDKVLRYYNCEYDFRFQMTKCYKTRYELVSDLVVILDQQQYLSQAIIFVSFSHFSSYNDIADFSHFSEFSSYSPDDFASIPITKLSV